MTSEVQRMLVVAPSAGDGQMRRMEMIASIKHLQVIYLKLPPCRERTSEIPIFYASYEYMVLKVVGVIIILYTWLI